jgi:hypothetical protein
LALDLIWKDLNHWLKVVIMNCQILTVKGYLSWPFYGGAVEAMVSIIQKEPYRDGVKY